MPPGIEARSHAGQRRFGRQRQSGGPVPPHPSPLPKGEGATLAALRTYGRLPRRNNSQAQIPGTPSWHSVLPPAFGRGRFGRMSATLTLNLDFDVLRLAEREALARHTTLPEVIAHQLRVMARNWQDSQAGRTPLTDALHGAVKLPADFDERASSYWRR